VGGASPLPPPQVRQGVRHSYPSHRQLLVGSCETLRQHYQPGQRTRLSIPWMMALSYPTSATLPCMPEGA
jgi:hypothetical protein